MAWILPSFSLFEQPCLHATDSRGLAVLLHDRLYPAGCCPSKRKPDGDLGRIPHRYDVGSVASMHKDPFDPFGLSEAAPNDPSPPSIRDRVESQEPQELAGGLAGPRARPIGLRPASKVRPQRVSIDPVVVSIDSAQDCPLAALPMHRSATRPLSMARIGIDHPIPTGAHASFSAAKVLDVSDRSTGAGQTISQLERAVSQKRFGESPATSPCDER